MGYPRPPHTIIDAGPHQALVEDLPASVQDSKGPAHRDTSLVQELGHKAATPCSLTISRDNLAPTLSRIR